MWGGCVSAHSCPADVSGITRLPQLNSSNCASDMFTDTSATAHLYTNEYIIRNVINIKYAMYAQNIKS